MNNRSRDICFARVKCCSQKGFLKNEKLSCRSQYGLDRRLAEVRSGRGPIFRIFHEVSSDQSGVGVCAGEYPYHTSTAADLPVQPFQHVGGRNLSWVQLWKSVKRQRVLQTFFPAADGFGNAMLLLSADFFSQPASLLSGGGQPGG